MTAMTEWAVEELGRGNRRMRRELGNGIVLLAAEAGPNEATWVAYEPAKQEDALAVGTEKTRAEAMIAADQWVTAGEHDVRFITDWRGNKIKEGDTVLYGTSQSNSVSINEGRVEAIIDVPAKYGGGMSVKMKIRQLRSSPYTSKVVPYMNPTHAKVVTISAIERVTKLEG